MFSIRSTKTYNHRHHSRHRNSPHRKKWEQYPCCAGIIHRPEMIQEEKAATCVCKWRCINRFAFCSYLASAPPNSGYVLPGHAFDLIGLSPPRGPHGGALLDTSIVSASVCHRLRSGCAETSKSWMRLDANQSDRLCGLPVTRQQRECKEYAELFGFQDAHNRGGYVPILIFGTKD